MFRKLYSLVICVSALWLSSCMSEETFKTSAGDRLNFSVDTLSFDTVIAGVGTSTKHFMVYNRNADGISITDVDFEEGSQGYRVNVSGMYINEGLSQPIDCRKDDSLRVFVELTPKESNVDEPIYNMVHLRFTLANGTSQSVVLKAFEQNVITMKACRLEHDTVLSAKRPYVVYDSLVVAPNAKLTLTEGTRLYFHNNAKLIVEGSLQANGTQEQPIVFRGDRTDYMFDNQPYDRIPNQWYGIRFTKTSFGNHLNYCDIHSANQGIWCDSSDVNIEKLKMENSMVHNMAHNCLTAFSSRIFVGNSQITNAGGNCVTLFGGDVDMVHTTIANFDPFSASRGAALVYSNEYHNSAYPLLRASFRNCIITGYSDDEIYGQKSTDFPNAEFNYLFQNSLLNTPVVDNDAQIMNCKYDNAKQSVKHEGNFPKFNMAHLLFNFSLVEKSTARDMGDTEITSIFYPTDRNGVSRLSDGQSDAGCYEYQPKQTNE